MYNYYSFHFFNYNWSKINLLFLFASLVFADTADLKMSISFEWQKEIATKKNKNILDFFFLLPAEFLDCENIKSGFPTEAERKELCKLIDEKNGYIKFFNAAEIALFKNRNDSIDFISLQIGRCGAGSTCGGVNTVLQFLTPENCWVKREDLLPKGFTFEQLYEQYAEQDKCPYFKLPQKGLIIEIRDENTEDVLADIKWDGERFLKLK